MANNVVVINPGDNVAVAIIEIKAGSRLEGLQVGLDTIADIPRNHKVAITDIPADAKVIKYGEPIGKAMKDIKAGDWVHTHNLKSEGD